jgi:serine/threonine protein kinase
VNFQKLNALNSPRFDHDYANRSLIGSGTFGDVFKGIKRIEGIIYAVKVAKKPKIKNLNRSVIQREISAMAGKGIFKLLFNLLTLKTIEL